MAQLQEQGVIVLQGVFPKSVLTRLEKSAEACFAAVEAGRVQSLATVHKFSPFSYSALLPALLEFDAGSPEELLAPVHAAGLEGLGSCDVDQAWVRKRYAPMHAPLLYRPNSWHQDGGLGAVFGPEPESVTPLTPLVTCWIPLHACGVDCPGLEFVRHRLDDLLHYSKLNDVSLRQRFGPEQFWAPALEFGDGLLFLAGTLHRTHVQPEMRRDRLSVEYRFFA